jgi:hypothetical protein
VFLELINEKQIKNGFPKPFGERPIESGLLSLAGLLPFFLGCLRSLEVVTV